MATTARIEVRTEDEVKSTIERAAAIQGLSITDFVLNIAKSRADKVIAKYERMTLEDDAFDQFFTACLESDNTPNQALQDAAEFAKKQGF